MFENVRRWGEVVAEERSEPEKKKKNKFKVSCDSRFQRVFSACSSILKEITLV
jgi:hypothetical protein